MGRARSNHRYIPPEMEEDLGIPGKLYIEKPKVIEITRTVSSDNKDARVFSFDVTATSGACRSVSIRERRGFNGPDDIEYGISMRPTVADIEKYLKQNEIRGYGEGAIVARRWGYRYEWRSHFNWGVITLVHKYGSFNENYHPYTVRWWSTPPSDDKVWAEDLVVIHSHLSTDLLSELVEAQGVPTT